MEFNEIIKKAVASNASDIFIISGLPISFKEQGVIKEVNDKPLMPNETEAVIKQIYETAGRSIDKFLKDGDDDFSLSVAGLSRFRICSYKQRGTLAAVIRVVSFDVPHYDELSIPEGIIKDAANLTKGLVLVTGPAGGGKSTTLACIINEINETRGGHIITLEDPIEYLHKNKKSIISQREISSDTGSYITALRACLRQSPDVILLGEMRDYETISTVMTAVETGHLVISTLHSMGAENTVDRIIDIFPPAQQQQIRIQISQLLQIVVSQQLIPCVDGTLRPCFEIMKCNNAIRNIIRESKTHQIETVITSSGSEGMVTMDNYLLSMYRSGTISEEVLMRHASNPDVMMKRMSK